LIEAVYELILAVLLQLVLNPEFCVLKEQRDGPEKVSNNSESKDLSGAKFLKNSE